MIHKCCICNHVVWPWQRESPTDISGCHYSCHKKALGIDRKHHPEESEMLDAAIDDFERRTGHATGFKSHDKEDTSDHLKTDTERYIEQCITRTEEMISAFPDQPNHKRQLEQLRKSQVWARQFYQSLSMDRTQ